MWKRRNTSGAIGQYQLQNIKKSFKTCIEIRLYSLCGACVTLFWLVSPSSITDKWSSKTVTYLSSRLQRTRHSTLEFGASMLRLRPHLDLENLLLSIAPTLIQTWNCRPKHELILLNDEKIHDNSAESNFLNWFFFSDTTRVITSERRYSSKFVAYYFQSVNQNELQGRNACSFAIVDEE